MNRSLLCVLALLLASSFATADPVTAFTDLGPRGTYQGNKSYFLPLSVTLFGVQFSPSETVVLSQIGVALSVQPGNVSNLSVDLLAAAGGAPGIVPLESWTVDAASLPVKGRIDALTTLLAARPFVPLMQGSEYWPMGQGLGGSIGWNESPGAIGTENSEITYPNTLFNDRQLAAFDVVGTSTSNAMAVPEPSSLQLLIVGLGLLGAGGALRHKWCH